MPVPPAELIAEFTIETSPDGEQSPQNQIDAGREVAGASGLARETGPESTVLSGPHAEVLQALPKVIQASLDAGARAIRVRVEVTTELRQTT